MNRNRINELRAVLQDESISFAELVEIEDRFAAVPDWKLRDFRVNATAADMLDDLEDELPPDHRYNPAPFCSKCGDHCQMETEN